MTSRLPDWRSRLYQLMADSEAVPFKYGMNDCAIFAGKVIEAVTGENIYNDYVGKYRTPAGGLRKFKAATGIKTPIHFLEANYETSHIAFAREGDLGIVETDEGPAIVVILGEFAAGVGPQGLFRLPVTDVISSFKLGD